MKYLTKKFYSSFSTYFLICNHSLLACITDETSCISICICKKIRKNIENFVISILIFKKIGKLKKNGINLAHIADRDEI